MKKDLISSIVEKLTKGQKQKYIFYEKKIDASCFSLSEFCKDSDMIEIVGEKKEGFLYLFKCGDHYKIGFSRDVGVRFRQIKGGVPYHMSIVAYAFLDDARKAEEYWQDYYARYRVHGEWFKFNKNEFMDMVMFMSSVGGIFLKSEVYPQAEIEETDVLIKSLMAEKQRDEVVSRLSR